MNEEGVIKFNCTWIKASPLEEFMVKDINTWRDTLYKSGLIGMDKDGIGYGNVSKRYEKNTFMISGSSTGRFEKLGAQHYALVTEYDFEQNTLTTVGPTIASSESLTHAVIYESQEKINSVMHVHHPALWEKLLHKFPSTDKRIAYGTTLMAKEISRLFKESRLFKNKIFTMGGHEAGIVAFGRDPDEAGNIIMNELRLL